MGTFIEKHLQQLVGNTIVGVVVPPDQSDPDAVFGVQVVSSDGSRRTIWILQDAESNGPGWLEIERSE